MPTQYQPNVKTHRHEHGHRMKKSVLGRSVGKRSRARVPPPLPTPERVEVSDEWLDEMTDMLFAEGWLR